MGFESFPSQSEPRKPLREEEAVAAQGPAPHPDFGASEEVGETPFTERDPLARFREALSALRVGRDPNKEIDADGERIRIATELQRISEAIGEAESGGEKEPVSPHVAELESEATEAKLPELKEMKEEFEKEEKKVALAEQYNDVLESLAKLDDEELQSVIDTGRTKAGGKLRSKRNEELAPEIAKHLADLAKHGVRRLTWGSFNRMLQLFDAVLKDLIAPFKELKRLIGLGR